MPCVRHDLMRRLQIRIPLTIVEGIVGTGKSRLVRCFVNDQSGAETCVLVELGPDDRDMLVVLTRMWLALTLAADRGDEPLPRSIDDLEAKISEVVVSHREPVLFVIDEWHGDASELLECFGRLRAESPTTRLVVTTIDGSRLRQWSRLHEVVFASIDDRDLMLTTEQIAAIAEPVIGTVSPEALAHLEEMTRGNVGLIRILLRDFPQEFHDGTLAWRDAVYRYTFMDTSHAPFVRFMWRMSAVPRFTLEQAEYISGDDLAREHLRRLELWGVVSARHHVGTRNRVFMWDEVVREFISGVYPDSRRSPVRLAHWHKVARSTGDLELEAWTAVTMGDRQYTDDVLDSHLWEVLAGVGEVEWEGLSSLATNLRSNLGALALRSRALADTQSPSSAVSRSMRGLATSLAESPTNDVNERIRWATRAAFVCVETGDPVAGRAWIGRALSDVSGVVEARAIDDVVALTSDLLVLAHLHLQIDDARMAAKIASLVLSLLESGAASGSGVSPGMLESRGHHARRLERYAAVHLGLVDQLERSMSSHGAVLDDRRPETIVINGVLGFWSALDRLDLAAAETASRTMWDRLEQPSRWPAVRLSRALMFLLRGRRGQFEALVRSGFDSADWRHRNIAPTWINATAGLEHELAKLITGRPLIEDLPLIGGAYGELVTALSRLLTGNSDSEVSVALLDVLPVRFRMVLTFTAAVRSMRLGHEVQAVEMLRRAVLDARGRKLVPLPLAFALTADVEGLRQLVADDSTFAVLQLDGALALSHTSVKVLVRPELSTREIEILTLLHRGKSGQEIADELFVSINTVKFHRRNLLRKLGVGTTRDALAAASRWGYRGEEGG